MVTLRSAPDPQRDATQIFLCMSDHPGLFSRLTGAMALAGANILEARIFTTKTGMALNSFSLQDMDGVAYDKCDSKSGQGGQCDGQPITQAEPEKIVTYAIHCYPSARGTCLIPASRIVFKTDPLRS